MSNAIKTIFYGEALIDVVVKDGVVLIENVGGSPLNSAVALARQGHRAAIVTPMSRDDRGEKIKQSLVNSGVDTSLLYETNLATTVANAQIQSDGSSKYDFVISGTSQDEWGNIDIASGPTEGDILSVSGSFALGVDSMAEVIGKVITIGSKYHTLIFDPNVRPSVISQHADKAKALKRFEDWAKLATVVKASDEDMQWLYGNAPLPEVAKRLLDSGTKLFIVTQGGSGATAWTSSQKVSVAAEQVEVVDTIGAGDTFNAGVIAALIEKGILSKEAIASIGENDLKDVVERGVRMSAEVCARQGADPPWAKQLER